MSAITIELMTQGAKKRQVLDTTQAFVRQDPDDFKDFTEEAKVGIIEGEWLTDKPFERLKGFKALNGSRAETEDQMQDLDEAWSWMQAAVLNILCAKKKVVGARRRF